LRAHSLFRTVADFAKALKAVRVRETIFNIAPFLSNAFVFKCKHLADFADALEAVAHLDSLLEQQFQGQHVRLLLQRSASKGVSLIYLFVFNSTIRGFS
jgi:hypothetical protein